MMQRLRQRASDESGFTLIELLVVILIIGILAAIAIPAFLNQTQKANDSSAKSLARNAATIAQSYASENSGNFKGLSPAEINKLEKSIPDAAGNSQAYISKAIAVAGTGTTECTTSCDGYVITATAPTTEDTFTITDHEGEITRTCNVKGGTGAAETGGGCKAGDW